VKALPIPTAPASLPAIGIQPARLLLYLILVGFAIFYLVPVYVLVNNALKSFEEVSLSRMWAPSPHLTAESFVKAADKLAPNLWNSLVLVVPASLLAAMWGSINGYILAKWRFRGAGIVFPILLFGMFIPYQSILIPLVQFLQWLGRVQPIHLYGSITGLVVVHIIYGLPITTLIFRNYYATVPTEIVEAARIDGAGLAGIYRTIMVPLSMPALVVVLIWELTQVWNEFLFAVVITGNPAQQPVQVALRNLAGSQIVEWNVQMAGALLAALPPLIMYIFLGRFFLRGLMAGALKG
jgi:glucose/mannose transport system permease protein